MNDKRPPEMPGRVAAALISLFLLAVIGGSTLGYGLSQTQIAADRATRAMCSLRQSYADQLHSTVMYLASHPSGNPSLGLSRSYFERTIASLRLRIASLSDVECR